VGKDTECEGKGGRLSGARRSDETWKEVKGCARSLKRKKKVKDKKSVPPSAN